MLHALRSASCDITHETWGTTCYGHWVLRLVISHTRQGVRLLRALGSASRDITHETGGTVLLRALGSASRDITHETEARASTQVLRRRFVAGVWGSN